jgi:hypothetical protein
MPAGSPNYFAQKGQFIQLNKDSINQFYFSLMLKDRENSEAKSINGFVDNFSLRQSLLRYSMSLELSIRDSAQLIDKSVLRLGSILELVLFRDPDHPESAKIRKTFYVTNIDSSIQSLTPNERVYDITAFTFAGVSNAWPFTEVYEAGKTPSDIIKDIVTKRFTSDTKSIGEDTIGWIPTENALDTPTIFKQVAPFDAITNMLRRSTRETKDSTYFFYEDIEGFKLRTIGDMTKKEYLDFATNNPYTFLPDKKPASGDSRNSDPKKDYYRILYLTQHNNSDYFKLMENGVHSSEIVYIDLLNRTIGNDNGKYAYEYSNTEYRDLILSTGDFDAFDIEKEVFTKKGYANKDAPPPDVYDFTPASKIVFSEKAWDRTDYMDSKYPYDSAQRALFEQNKVTIEVYGNPEIKPGDIIYIEIPKQSGETGYTRRLTGSYLVTGIKHNVKGNIFQTIIDLHKDSYEQDVLTESKDNTSTAS